MLEYYENGIEKYQGTSSPETEFAKLILQSKSMRIWWLS